MRNIRSGLFPLLFAALFAACSQEGSSTDRPNSGETGGARLHINIAKSQVPLSDSLVLDLVGPDSFHVVLPGDSASYDKILDPGDWNFYAKFYANGILVQQGEAEAKLSADDDRTISIEMKAVAGFLAVQVPIGLGNPTGIARGTLLVTGQDFKEEYELQIGDLEATVATGLLKIGTTYTVLLRLYSENGEVLYETSAQVTIDGENFAVAWKLSSLHANVAFSIQADSLRTLAAVAYLPAKVRAPKEGDLLISEFMTETTNGEFVELYNSSVDTLDLSGCELWATNTSTFKLATDPLVDIKVSPNSYLVFGKDSCEGRDVAAALSLPGTKGSIAFRCGSETIDSLYFTKTGNDSLGIAAFPSGLKNYSAQLPLKNFRTKSRGDSWCAGAYSLHSDARCNE